MVIIRAKATIGYGKFYVLLLHRRRRLDNRVDNAAKFRSPYKGGCKIKTRLGLHEVSDGSCSNDGIIVLQPYGTREDVETLVKELNELEGVAQVSI